MYKVKNFETKGDKIICSITDGKVITDMTIDKDEFEHWLTEGTGVVTYPIVFDNGSGVIDETEVKHTIEQYWTVGREINDSEICGDIERFMKAEPVYQQIARGEIAAQQLTDLFGSSQTMKLILDYGAAKALKVLNERANRRLFNKAA